MSNLELKLEQHRDLNHSVATPPVTVQRPEVRPGTDSFF